MKVRQRVSLEFALALGILAITGLVSYRSLTRVTDTLHSLSKSYDRVYKLAFLQSRLSIVRSAGQDYALTGNIQYYQTFVSADQIVARGVVDVQESFASDGQHPAFGNLRRAIESDTADLRELVNSRRTTGPLDAERKAQVTATSDSISHISRVMDEIRLGEIQILAKREQEVAAKTNETVLTLGGASAASFLLLISAFYLLTGEVQQRERREEEIRRFSSALEQRNKEVERATRLKSQFLASMSHELRTPLNAIIGFSDLLAEDSSGSISAKQKRHLEHIRTAGRHLLQLINDILDLAKVETGRMTLQLENLAVADVLPEVLSTISPLAMRKKIAVENDIWGTLWLKADRVRLKQALYNLLSNAVKFTPDGGRISINGNQQGELVEIAVADTGCGIRPQDHQVIFEEFRQIGETTKGVREGTGLGLAITRKLIQQQGGTIRVESQEGQGAKFIFTLPAAPPPAEPPQETEPADAKLTGRPLVLVVDDEPVARELLVSHLAVEGYRTATAGSGPEAVARAADLHPDVITLDILTGGPKGAATLSELKRRPGTATIPVVVVTVADQKEETLLLGAAEYLIKPVRREDLIAAIERQARARAEARPIVLIVDDDPEIRNLLSERLETAGYCAMVSGSGREALDALWHTRVQAIILDLVLPEMDGFEVIRQIRRNPRLHAIPFFVLTDKDRTVKENEAMGREVCGRFRKQGEWIEDLLTQVHRVINRPAGTS